jgi:hypothetical protein
MHVSTVPSAWATSMLALTIPAVSKPVAAVTDGQGDVFRASSKCLSTLLESRAPPVQDAKVSVRPGQRPYGSDHFWLALSLQV